MRCKNEGTYFGFNVGFLDDSRNHSLPHISLLSTGFFKNQAKLRYIII